MQCWRGEWDTDLSFGLLHKVAALHFFYTAQAFTIALSNEEASDI